MTQKAVLAIKKTEHLVQCYVVGDECADQYWESHYGPMISAALENGPDGCTLADIKEDIACGSLLINISVDGQITAAAVLDFEVQREVRYLHVHTLTGARMEDWLAEFVEYLRYLRIGLDCDAVSLVGRMGWHKVLKEYGFKTKHVMMQLEQ